VAPPAVGTFTIATITLTELPGYPSNPGISNLNILNPECFSTTVQFDPVRLQGTATLAATGKHEKELPPNGSDRHQSEKFQGYP